MIAAIAALIAILPATQHQSLQLNSGFYSQSNISAYMFPQSLHLAQLEPELLLQPDGQHLPGKVEASNPSDIREHLGDS